MFDESITSDIVIVDNFHDAIYCTFQVDKGVEHRAAHTLPNGLWVRNSSIPNAGLGVFSTEFIPKGTRFGPYDGVIESNYDKAHSTGYSWQVNTTQWFIERSLST